jgi:LacI family transcriptional regulator
MRARIEDVAAAASVSIKTVSRVLNREPNVREDTRARVLEAARKLQYTPNPSARSLAAQRSYVVALVYDNPSRNYLMEIQAGMLEACRANNYNLVLGPLEPARRKRDAIRGLFEHFAPEGVVLIPPLTDDPAVVAYLQEHGVPFACVSPRHPDRCIGVMMDDQAAVSELMAHLLALGHRRIGHIQGHPEHGASVWRHAAYRDALRRAGIAYDPTLVVPGEFVFESGVLGGGALLDLPDPPTAIFAANDDTAAGVIHVAAERGLSIPRDVSVCGFDDTAIARHIYPSLTTVHQPTADMGRTATEQLLACLHDPQAARMVRMQHALIVRRSTGPVPAAARGRTQAVAGAGARTRTREPRNA